MKRNDVDKSRKLRSNQTDAEKKLWASLRNRQLEGIKFRRQFPRGGYIVDFYSPEYRLGIEADGGGHYENEGRQRDEFRTRELSKLGVEIIRFSDQDILTNIEGVCERIKKVIEEKKNNPPHCRFSRFGPLPFGYSYGWGAAGRQIWPKGHLRPSSLSLYWRAGAASRLLRFIQSVPLRFHRNLNDGMSLCDRAGLHPLPKGRGDKEFFAKRSIKRSVSREFRRRQDLNL